jgi:SAM-dependent methyltransferase
MVTCFEILEHLRHDPMFMMLEIHRVLRNDGVLVLSTPNASSWLTLVRVAGLESPFGFSTYFANGSGIGHSKEYSISEIEQLLENAGFRTEKLETLNTESPDLHLRQKTGGLHETLRRQDWWKEELRGETLLLQARKSGKPKMRKYFPLYTEDIPYIESREDLVRYEDKKWAKQVETQRVRAHELESELNSVRRTLTELQTEFEERSRWALDLDKEVRSQNEMISQLQSEVEERGRWAQELDKQIHGQRSQISQLQTEVGELEMKLNSLRFLWRQLLRRIHHSLSLRKNR